MWIEWQRSNRGLGRSSTWPTSILWRVVGSWSRSFARFGRRRYGRFVQRRCPSHRCGARLGCWRMIGCLGCRRWPCRRWSRNGYLGRRRWCREGCRLWSGRCSNRMGISRSGCSCGGRCCNRHLVRCFLRATGVGIDWGRSVDTDTRHFCWRLRASEIQVRYQNIVKCARFDFFNSDVLTPIACSKGMWLICLPGDEWRTLRDQQGLGKTGKTSSTDLHQLEHANLSS